MTALYSIAEIRAIEQAALVTLPPGTLMQRAGRAAAELAQTLIAGPTANARILLLAGPGNNGGDALQAAAHLARAGLQAHVLRYSASEPVSADCAQALAQAEHSGVRIVEPSQLPHLMKTDWALVIDGLFGIGLSRPLTGEMRAAIEYVNTLACPILALDVPSGLNADTGNLVGGTGGVALCASQTLTFIGDKPGLHTADGRDYAGVVEVADLGIERGLFKPTKAQLNAPALFAEWLRRRRQNSHKGSYGNLALIGGASGMAGAPVLAARAALYCGAGRVFVGFLEPAGAFDDAHPELMLRDARDLDFAAMSLAIGPGLGTSRLAHDLLRQALGADTPLAIDADALNLLAAEPGLQHKLRQRRAASLLTPHPLEAARLLGTSAAAVQTDRLAAARTLARQFNATVILKGSGSVIAESNGMATINPNGNPALASAGTGDVLSGVCGALLAQGWPPVPTAHAAVWLHGAAADQLVTQGLGPVGLTAGELIPAIRASLNQAIRDYAR